MDEAGHQLLARTGFTDDQDGCIGRRHPGRQFQDLCHRRIAEDECVVFLRYRLEYGGDQVGIRRQRYILLGAGFDGAGGGGRIGAEPTCDDGHADVLRIQALDQPTDVEIHIYHDQIGSMAGPESMQCGLDIVGMGDLGSARDRELTCRADIPIQ